jgi:hypothetical protein
VDVIVVIDGDASQTKLEDALVAEGRALGREVNVVFVTKADWTDATSPFLRTIKSRPLVPLTRADNVG